MDARTKKWQTHGTRRFDHAGRRAEGERRRPPLEMSLARGETEIKIPSGLYFSVAFTLAMSGAALLPGCAVDSAASDSTATPAAEDGTDENIEEVQSEVVGCSNYQCSN